MPYMTLIEIPFLIHEHVFGNYIPTMNPLLYKYQIILID